ncbi:carbohydrate ABC transporter permease [Breznakiella homolactica]|uniref:Carbohydrate ABC transporter permease n=1 Tax=Breznakiella homolactica TaxID=2798577 RepID=A0A7T8BCF3_9SPIR|nr:carbohydrate ABC transporter permease [Breznakiella homolactica]QQO11376.1 carbohydrate ABC transporter permease [Breznakiella homolactica]
MAAVLIVVIMPIVFMFTASLMPSSEIFAMPYRWIPKKIHWENYYNAIAGNDRSFMFIRNVFNSLIVASVTTVLSVFVSGLAGYGLSKFRFRGQKVVFMMIMGRMMIPFEAIMIPMYITAVRLGLQNTYAGMILPFILNTFGLFQMRQYLMTFPDDMLDAGRIDGLGEMGIFWKLVFKNSTPAIATAAILCFRGQWDNLLWPLLIAQKEHMKTIPTYIVKFTEEKFANEGAMMAVAVLASIPIIILFLTLSKYFLGGSAMYSAGKE